MEKEFSEGLHKGKVIDEREGYTIVDCEGCGYTHIHPIPTKEELHKVYAEEYYDSEKPDYIEHAKADLEWWNVAYDERYDFLESVLSIKERRILDIGCGPGYFLKRGMDRGWSVLGVEPSKQAASHAESLGVEVINSFLDDASAIDSTSPFNAIHLSEVLEHVPEPREILYKTYELLEDGGIIAAIVPNDYNPVQNVLRYKMDFEPYWLAPPHHINYFNFDSMERLLKSVGFKVMKRSSTFPIDFFLLMGDNYIGDDKLGRECHGRRKNLDIMLNEPEFNNFKEDLYGLMARHSIGRELIVYARKEGGGK